jgi:hypothetical protein
VVEEEHFVSSSAKSQPLVRPESLRFDFQVGMAKGQHWQIARFDFEGCDFHALPYFIFLP